MKILKTFVIGLIMGACDVVPGVSGGTIAFISGIYDRLLGAIAAIASIQSLQEFRDVRIKDFIARTDIYFLVTLFVGVIVAILLFAPILAHWLEIVPHLVRGFFAGLVVASVLYLISKQKNRDVKTILALILGSVFAYILIGLSPTQIEPTRRMIILAAMIAISAMILPGISGSFLLLIMGMYIPVLTALHDKDMAFIVLFGLGAMLGLLTIVRVVKHALNSHYAVTISILIGFLLGALPKLRPRQVPSETITRDDGEVRVIQTENVMPDMYEQNAHFLWVVLLFICGIGGSLGLMSIAHSGKKEEE